MLTQWAQVAQIRLFYCRNARGLHQDLCQILQYTLPQQSTETAILTDRNVSAILYNNDLAFLSNFLVHWMSKKCQTLTCLLMFLICNTSRQTYCTVYKYSLTLSLPILNKEKHCKTPREQLKGLWTLKLSGEALSPRHPKGIISEMIWDQHWPCGLLGGRWGTTLT